jgi:hypothetical protein
MDKLGPTFAPNPPGPSKGWVAYCPYGPVVSLSRSLLDGRRLVVQRDVGFVDGGDMFAVGWILDVVSDAGTEPVQAVRLADGPSVFRTCAEALQIGEKAAIALDRRPADPFASILPKEIPAMPASATSTHLIDVRPADPPSWNARALPAAWSTSAWPRLCCARRVRCAATGPGLSRPWCSSSIPRPASSCWPRATTARSAMSWPQAAFCMRTPSLPDQRDADDRGAWMEPLPPNWHPPAGWQPVRGAAPARPSLTPDERLRVEGFLQEAERLRRYRLDMDMLYKRMLAVPERGKTATLARL